MNEVLTVRVNAPDPANNLVIQVPCQQYALIEITVTSEGNLFATIVPHEKQAYTRPIDPKTHEGLPK